MVYEVLPGDSFWSIAHTYGVSIADLKRWNPRIARSGLRPGQRLVVYPRTPVRSRRLVPVVVRRGDTLSAIARRYGMSVKMLKRINRIRDPRKLRAGQRLQVVVEGPEHPSEAVGRPQHGRLVNGEQLPPAPGFYVRKRPRNAWGTNETITQLIAAVRAVHANRRLRRKYHGHIPPVVIGDISRKGGGPLPPHKSHQSGRDVDIGYYVRGKAPKDFVSVTKSTLDYELTWALLEALLDQHAVEYVFMDRRVQRWLADWLVRTGRLSRAKVRELFQVDGGRGRVFRHEPGHLNHMHVRFRCPEDDAQCKW